MLREKRNIELWRMSKMLYQLLDQWRVQGNHAGHEGTPKMKKKKSSLFMSMYCSVNYTQN